MVDSYPSRAGDADHSVQLLIDGELANAQRLFAKFEKNYPREANAASVLRRVSNRPRKDALYPRLSALEDRREWLVPLVRRYQWQRYPGDSETWADLLGEMIEIALAQAAPVNEKDFLLLADAAGVFVERYRARYVSQMATFAMALEKEGPLSPSVVDALRQLLRFCEGTGEIGTRVLLVWPLFRASGAFDDSDPSWSARIHRHLQAVKPELRTPWLGVLDAVRGNQCGGVVEPSRSALAAVKRLGAESLEEGLRPWVDLLHEKPRLVLTPVCDVVLQYVMVLCDLVGSPRSDQLLYDIARAPWTQALPHNCTQTYLWAMRRRSQDCAFACLEALMMRPATAVSEIRRAYEALLAVFGAKAGATSALGVDGFRLDSDPALLPQQTRLDQLLRMAAKAASEGPYVDPRVTAHMVALQSMKEEDKTAAMKAWESQMMRLLPWFPVSPDVTAAHEAMEAAILKEFSTDATSLHRATVLREEWIVAHQKEHARDAVRLWKNWLHRIVSRTLARIEELPLDSLLGAIAAGGGNDKILELSGKYVVKNGWKPELVSALRQWVSTLFGSVTDQGDRVKAEWFLWFEDVEPIQLDECWSHRVKRDLRAMSAAERANWVALFENHSFAISGKPPAKWSKQAGKVFERVGPENFRRYFVEWFGVFNGGDALRVTVTGRHILRVLMWYALIAQDRAVDEALVGFARAKWKTKEVAKRVAQAEMAFSHVLAERAPETALPVLEELVLSGQAFEGSETHKVYQQLCTRSGRTEVAAVAKPLKPPKSPLLSSSM
ncbi:MAG TPA: hypothetical protein VGL72_09510 [Bryobacteraceae bacterium]|jgi:hypothetical protein